MRFVYYITLIFFITSCVEVKECDLKLYNYPIIDTNKVNKDLFFFNGQGDSLVLKKIAFEFSMVDSSINSISNYQQCGNSLSYEYSINKENLLVSINKTENSYDCYIVMNCDYFDVFEDTIFSFDKTIKISSNECKSYINEISIKDGLIYKIKDTNNIEWFVDN